MALEVTGKIHEIYPEQQVKESFRKREFVLAIEDGQYPQFVKFETTQDRVSILQGLHKEDRVKVAFDLSGRPWTNKEGQVVYFNSLRAWKIERIDEMGGGRGADVSPVSYSQKPVSKTGDEFDDVPF